jgi:hypothetical protein
VLAVALAVAGVMHLLLTPDHLADSTLMGVGFVAAGIAELGLAGAVLLRPGRAAYLAVIGVAALLVALYLYNVLVGLPFAGGASAPAATEAAEPAREHGEGTGDHQEEEAGAHGEGEEQTSHHGDGLVLGAGEPIDAAGAATKGAELVSLGLASVLLLRERRTR